MSSTSDHILEFHDINCNKSGTDMQRGEMQIRTGEDSFVKRLL